MSLRVIASVALMLLCAVTDCGFGQWCNPEATGECDEVHKTPGCRITECCDQVCEADPICCEVEWDKLCVEAQAEFCGGYACPGLQTCDADSLEPGCSNQDCCRLVCNHDWFCCWIRWDDYCISLAESICEVAPCELTIPDEAVFETEVCYERLNDGCNGAEPAFDQLNCGDSVVGTCTTDTPRDTDWYALSISEPTTIQVTLESEFPAQLVLVSGPCEGPVETHVLVSSAPCRGEVEFAYALDPGTWSLVVGPGTDMKPVRGGLPCDQEETDGFMGDDSTSEEPSFFGLRYLLRLSCESDGLLGDLNQDGNVDGADILIVLAWWGTDDPTSDIDGNGVVNGADLLIVLAYWTG